MQLCPIHIVSEPEAWLFVGTHNNVVTLDHDKCVARRNDVIRNAHGQVGYTSLQSDQALKEGLMTRGEHMLWSAADKKLSVLLSLCASIFLVSPSYLILNG